MLDDPADSNGPNSDLKKRVARLEIAADRGGDTDHAGTGAYSLQVGFNADASGDGSAALGTYSSAGGLNSTATGPASSAQAENATAVGQSAYAGAVDSTALGHDAYVGDTHDRSFAVGSDSATENPDEGRIGASNHTIVVPGDLSVEGTFSNPSARHLKQAIIPAPDMVSIFPELTEYEYIARAGARRIGYIADDLVGTDAERFVKFDGDGRPVAIDYLGLLVAQVARLNARITELEGR